MFFLRLSSPFVSSCTVAKFFDSCQKRKLNVTESAAIHTAFAIAFVTYYGLSAPINQVFIGFASAAQVRVILIRSLPVRS